MKTSFSFVRWSTKRQGKNSSDSKRRQIQSAKKWSHENGYVLDETLFVGAGESAFKGKHLKTKNGVALGALAKFIAAVENGTIKANSALCVDSVDRFSRQEILSALEPFTRLLNLGIGIVFTGSYNPILLTRDSVNKAPHLLQVVINDMIRSWSESDEKSRKVKEAKQRKRLEIQNGKPVPHNCAPKYFTWNKDTQQYEHNEKTATIRRLATMFLAGNSLYSIARKLNAEHIPSVKTDTNWSGNSIRSILRNRSLIGDFLGNKSFFPPIIKAADFDSIQNILNQNGTFNRGKVGSLVNVFRGTAFCSNCGKSMCTLTQRVDPRTKKPHANPNRYRYLRCSSQGTGKGCSHTYVLRLDGMEEEFFGNFLLQDPKQMVAGNVELEKLNADIAASQLKISQYGKTIANLLSLVDETSDMPELKAKLQSRTTERDNEKHHLDELLSQQGRMETTPKHFDDLKKLVNAVDAENDGETFIDDNLKIHLSPAAKEFDEAVQRINETLKDNEVRLKVRAMLPSLIGKILVNTQDRTWQVFNHSGKSIYQSLSHLVQ